MPEMRFNQGDRIPLPRIKKKYYAGIGSRHTPEDILALMRRAAYHLAQDGWVCRSGGAVGADTAFELGVRDGTIGAIRIYKKDLTCVEWVYQNGWSRITNHIPLKTWESAKKIAEKFHPAWSNLRDYVKPLMIRNTFQVLGEVKEIHSSFVLCWTPDGAVEQTTSATGGTGQAIRIANAFGVPVINLCREEHRERLEKWIQN